jgi:NAD(P)H-hydrate epimerase
MRALEEKAFSEGVSADELMEDAGQQIALAVRQFFPRPGVCAALFGKGNNGGDALVAARHLAAWGWNVWLVAAYPDSEWGSLATAKFAAATGCRRADVAQLEFVSGEPLVVLDGLLGTGARGPLGEPLCDITRAINQRRRTSNACVFALDLPTGLDGDTGAPDPACVVADHTLTIGFAKQGLIEDRATNFVGRLSVLPLRELSRRCDSSQIAAMPATPSVLTPLIARRNFDMHKGDFGRIGILAGSPGYLGAAVLCSAACVRAGAGLVTLYTPPDVADALARMAVPEVMVRPVPALGQLSAQRHDVYAIGPGMGQQAPAEFSRFIRNISVPVVLDADGLTALASNIEALSRADGERVLTPHPGEMERLVPGSASRPRREVVEAFTRRFPVTLLLKGARTIVGKAGEPLSFNTTGTPGMAVGGMGDVLTGVIAALIGQRIRPFDAARIGAWLCGRASEIAISAGGESEESLTPGRMLDFLGQAFRDLRAGCF